MKINLDNPESDVRIELLPLIDVIFCILTFFILAAMAVTRQTAINVDLPQATTGATQMRDMMIVSVDPVGQTYIDQQPVTREQLYQALVDYQTANPQGLMVLYASRLSSYNDVVQVLDLLRSVGGDRVALATLPNGNDAAQPEGSELEIPTTPGLDPANPYAPYGIPGGSDPFNPSYDPSQPLFPLEPSPNSGSSNPLQPTTP
ncbi:biopolymer transporter ExbD [Oscillatoria sp. FACHB-1407]|uniref:ExbD/TolR family protein n=1 Tax=Oscillatoria sp. FACHB-1407 TaxID=2692847 RepID=UPI00168941F8|nr:biopolymer transporter ExbD [Oscillatoria sp. FACHB-1407]MBD2461692.1 biopolymer transporter ExbD [Oscillatoria sp. FACHB-1407]